MMSILESSKLWKRESVKTRRVVFLKRHKGISENAMGK